MTLDEAKILLLLCGHDTNTLALNTECECEYCASERDYATRRAKTIRGKLRDFGWTPPKGESEQTHLVAEDCGNDRKIFRPTRDEIAVAAMQGLLSCGVGDRDEMVVAKASYMVADAMINQGKKNAV